MKCVSIHEAVDWAERAYQCSFRVVQRKRVLYTALLPSGESITLYTPQGSYQEQGFFWVDITEEQFLTIEQTMKAVIIFRLEGDLLVLLKWDELRKYLTKDCIRYNAHEGNHWKLYIYTDKIKVVGNENQLNIQMFHYTE